ncbi:hypothetical protein [Oceanobacillus sp. CAU 1775]
MGVLNYYIFIATSISGNKGYHIDIYFTKELEYRFIRKIYNATIIELENLTGSKIGIDNNNVELRPSYNKELKLPLGINFINKNTDTNVCWYADIYNNFKPYKSFDFVLSINQIDTNFIKNKEMSKQVNKFTETLEVD